MAVGHERPPALSLGISDLEVMMRYVLYHDQCFDGFGAAYVAHRRFGDDVTLVPVRHGYPPPDLQPDSVVYIIDFSYRRAELLELKARARQLIVLDHHKTAQDELEGLDFAHFDMNKSGAMLAWEHFFPNEEAPLLIRWIEDRDLWRWRYQETAPAMAALRSHPFDLDHWRELEQNPHQLVEEGRVALALIKQTVELIIRHSRMGKMAGFEVPMVNATCYCSEVGQALLEKYPDAPFAAAYHDLADGTRKWSLRSREHFDCAQIAKLYGGGGHPQASGFVTGAPEPF